MGRTTPGFAGASFNVGWIGASGWLAACLTLLAVHGILVVSPWNLSILMQEDGWVENLTAVAYLLAGALLLAAAWAETRRAPRFVLLAGGVAMAFIAGEEISWGQRIWDFPTPDFLAHNDHGEFNVHNLPDVVPFLKGASNLFTMLLCLTTAAALFSRKQGSFRVPLPSLPLLLLLLAILGSARISRMGFADDLRFWFGLFGRWQTVVLLLLAAWALFCKRPSLALAATATLILCLTCLYVRKHNGIYWNVVDETLEFLFSLFWLCYAGELLHGARAPRSWSDSAAVTVADERRGGGGAFPFLPAISWLALAGGAGLLALTHGNVRMERPELEAALQAVRSAAPDIRAEFDLHLADGKLTYIKQPCDQADADAGRFFLHILPKDEADLPRRRKRHGFDNLDFHFIERGVRIRGSCVAVASLPDYPIASIRTGQFDAHGHLWDATLFAAE